ncbi:MAG: hypothetical protein FJX29_10750 [Alphaproteobacteria bacterium]|nr:hypothetical protein [Alphaproteobacteria bacterium]
MPKKSAPLRPRETDLYGPVKTFLEGQGYEVKGEIGAADILARRGDEEPVIVELKTGFSLTLFQQAIERQKISDAVYIGVPLGAGRAFNKSLAANLILCRRLGLGLITVRLRDGFVCAHLDPAPYAPRQSKLRKERLLREFSRRAGDPNEGGSTRKPLVTAYRQDALRCMSILLDAGQAKAAAVAKITGVTQARRLMADDHYGWFERVTTGIYQLSPKGHAAVKDYAAELKRLAQDAPTAGVGEARVP